MYNDNTKFKIIMIGCLMVILTQAGISLYLPSLPFIKKTLHASNLMIGDTLTAYMLGYALPMLFWGAFADLYGRKKTLLVALSMFTIASLLLASTKSLTIFIFFRFLQGAGGGGCAIIGRIIIRDTCEKIFLVKAMSYVSISFIFALGACQALGGQIQHYLSWQYDFLLMALLGFIFAIIVLFNFSESIMISKDRSTNWINVLSIYREILGNKTFLLFAIGGGIGYGINIAYNVISPFLLQLSYGLHPIDYGHLGIYISISYIFGILILNYNVKKYKMVIFIKIGISLVITFGLIMLVAGWLGICNLYFFMVPLLIATLGQALIYPCCMAITLSDYKVNASYATASFGFIQQTLCCFVSGVASYLPHTQISLSSIIIVIGLIIFIFLYKLIIKNEE